MSTRWDTTLVWCRSICPRTHEGRRLIAHELTQVVQLDHTAWSAGSTYRVHAGGSFDVDLEGLQMAGGVLDITLDILRRAPKLEGGV